MRIIDIMSAPAVTVTDSTPLEEVARLMIDKRVGGLPVVDTVGELVGIVTESAFSAKDCGIPFSTFRAPQILGKWLTRDSIEKIFDAARKTPVSEIMHRAVISVTEDQPVSDAVALMLEHDINRVPVVRDGKPVGMIARHDLLRMMTPRD